MSQMFVDSIIQKKDDKAYFMPVGVVWENRDGWINFKLDTLGDTQFHIAKSKDKQNG